MFLKKSSYLFYIIEKNSTNPSHVDYLNLASLLLFIWFTYRSFEKNGVTVFTLSDTHKVIMNFEQLVLPISSSYTALDK